MTPREHNPEFLSPESRSKIENEFNKTSQQIGLGFSAALRYLKRIAIVFAVLLATVYAGDYLSVRFRIPNNREPTAIMEIQRYYAVTLKNGKTEITYDGSENQVCTNSLFPHMGYVPCWYLRRHTRKMIDI